MIRNKSNIFSVDRGINRKKNGKLLQQNATRIDAVFRPFFGWYLDQPKILDSFLKSICYMLMSLKYISKRFHLANFNRFRYLHQVGLNSNKLIAFLWTFNYSILDEMFQLQYKCYLIDSMTPRIVHKNISTAQRWCQAIKSLPGQFYLQ